MTLRLPPVTGCQEPYRQLRHPHTSSAGPQSSWPLAPWASVEPLLLPVPTSASGWLVPPPWASITQPQAQRPPPGSMLSPSHTPCGTGGAGSPDGLSPQPSQSLPSPSESGLYLAVLGPSFTHKPEGWRPEPCGPEPRDWPLPGAHPHRTHVVTLKSSRHSDPISAVWIIRIKPLPVSQPGGTLPARRGQLLDPGERGLDTWGPKLGGFWLVPGWGAHSGP